MKVEIKKLRNFMGSDMPGFSCSLYCDGKKVAEAIEYGNGAEMEIEFNKNFNQDLLKKYYISNNIELEEGYNVFGSNLICRLVDKFETDKLFKRITKNKTVVKYKGFSDNKYIEFNVPFNAANKEKLLKHVKGKGEEIEVIYNEIYRPEQLQNS